MTYAELRAILDRLEDRYPDAALEFADWPGGIIVHGPDDEWHATITTDGEIEWIR